MGASSTQSRFQFKSPLRIVVQWLLKSRETWRNKHQATRLELDEARRLADRQAAELKRQEMEMEELKLRIRQLERKDRTASQSPVVLPDDPPVNGHGYGPRMVSLSVNLARAVGLRGAKRTMKIMFDWLGVERKVPHATAIRTWLQRLGTAALDEPLERADDWVWIVDHSNQIGAEKVLVVLAVRASRLPPPGETLKHEHMRVLTVRPGTSWKREDVAAVYLELAERCGAPRAVLCDGAVELRESAAGLKTVRSDAIVLQDFKHKAANFLKASLEGDGRFAEFNALLGRTRSAIQQTELAHLTPLSLKQKARFMNLGRILDWGAMVLWTLEHPQAGARQDIAPARIEDKLGWLRSFADDLAAWRECQQAINQGVTFINEQGVFRGAAARLRAQLLPHATREVSQKLVAQLVEFVDQAESRLTADERLPLSSEILESCFALYKQLERQHSKGGFTSLLAAFAALLHPATPNSVVRAFSRVSIKDVKAWVCKHLGATLTSRRTSAYKEFRTNIRSATKATATS